MKTISLARTGLLTRQQVQTLAWYSIGTGAQLLALCELSDCRDGIKQLLGISDRDLSELRRRLLHRTGCTKAMLCPSPVSPGMLGAVLDDAPPTPVPMSAADVHPRGALRIVGHPRKIDLSKKLPPVRDQGGRGSCVAFGMVAAREFEAARQGRKEQLSEQHLYYLCKKNDGHRGGGTYPHIAVQQLEQVGVCPADVWPYNPVHDENNEGQGPPPAESESAAKPFRTLPGRPVIGKDIDQVKAVLAGKDGPQRPIVFGAMLFTSFFNAETRRTGKVVMPTGSEMFVGGHMMLATGYEDDESAPGGGWIHIRNSWGESWGRDSSVAPGYGLMPYAYWQNYARSKYVIEEEARIRWPMVNGRHIAALAAVIAFWALMGGLVIHRLDVVSHDATTRAPDRAQNDPMHTVAPLLRSYDQLQ